MRSDNSRQVSCAPGRPAQAVTSSAEAPSDSAEEVPAVTVPFLGSNTGFRVDFISNIGSDPIFSWKSGSACQILVSNDLDELNLYFRSIRVIFSI